MTKQLKRYQARIINEALTHCGPYKLQVLYFIDSGRNGATTAAGSRQPSTEISVAIQLQNVLCITYSVPIIIVQQQHCSLEMNKKYLWMYMYMKME